MKGTRDDNVEITLKMTGDEAEWLKNVMQNPLDGVEHMSEDKHQKKMRKLFFDVLHKTIGRLY